MTFCECGASLTAQAEIGRLCPACLFGLALDSSSSGADELDPAHDVQLIGPLGKGPHGVVYLGLSTRKYRALVTLKLLQRPVDADRFCDRISELAHQLRGMAAEGFQRLIGAGVTSEQQIYVVARYVPGVTITDFVLSQRGSGLDRARLAGELCALVEALHERNIVHGSIKSRNVLVTEGRNGAAPVLLDIGVAAAIEGDHAGGRPRPTPALADGITRDVLALKGLISGFLDQPPTAVLGDVRSAGAMAKLFRR
jgi:serine/threonine protein kinase